VSLDVATGVDLSKILGEATKILGQKVSITEEIKGVSHLLEGHVPRLPPPNLRLWMLRLVHEIVHSPVSLL